MPVAVRPALSVFSLLLFLIAMPASAQQTFANWTSNTTFDFGGAVTGSAATSNVINAADAMLTATGPQDGSPNYPSTWFSPTPPVGTVWSGGGVNATGGPGSVDVTVTFSETVFNPRFHFTNLDNGTVAFNGVAIARLSGNPEFEVTGNVANSTPNPAANGGCEDAMGNNPNGGCGTVELFGGLTSVTFTVADTDPSGGSGDGFAWTLSYDPAAAPVQAIPTVSEWGLLLLILLLAAAALPMLRR